MKHYYKQESNRLSYRKLNIDDLEAWSVFFDSNEREIFLGLGDQLSPTEKAKMWIELQLERYQNNEFGHLAIINKESGELVGVSGLLVRKVEDKIDYEVAYSIMPSVWGNGYATEAAQTMRAFAKANNLHHRVVSWIHEKNIFSQNVAKKNGLTFEGETVNFRGHEVQVWSSKI